MLTRYFQEALKGSYFLMSIEFNNDKFLYMDSGNDCTTIEMYLIALTSTHKND